MTCGLESCSWCICILWSQVSGDGELVAVGTDEGALLFFKLRAARKGDFRSTKLRIHPTHSLRALA
eukprot:SAG11_NODE_692_length_7698_cov_4.143308_5_plen_66_part_00